MECYMHTNCVLFIKYIQTSKYTKQDSSINTDEKDGFAVLN